jgi:hypothetical protein
LHKGKIGQSARQEKSFAMKRSARNGQARSENGRERTLTGFVPTSELGFGPRMKRMVVVSILTCCSMISGCQKQDSAAEAQLARRKAELDAREKALDQREQAVAQWEQALATSRPNPLNVQSRKPPIDSEQAKAERETRIQQLPPELQALIRDRSLLNPRTAETNRGTEDRGAELRRRLEEARRKKMSAVASPTADSSGTQPSSPPPSDTPQ